MVHLYHFLLCHADDLHQLNPMEMLLFPKHITFIYLILSINSSRIILNNMEGRGSPCLTPLLIWSQQISLPWQNILIDGFLKFSSIYLEIFWSIWKFFTAIEWWDILSKFFCKSRASIVSGNSFALRSLMMVCSVILLAKHPPILTHPLWHASKSILLEIRLLIILFVVLNIIDDIIIGL